MSIQTVLITGAARGLGLEFVRQYAADGWRIVACARAPAKAQALAAIKSRGAARITIHALEVTDHAGIEALANELRGTPIDVLLNVAGVLVPNGFGASNYDAWMNSMRINVLGPMKMAEAFVDHVAASAQKKIVTLSSMLGSIGGNTSGGMYDYRSTKAAVNAIMKSMSVDLAPRGIVAAPLHPGWVRTDMGGPRGDIDAVTSVSGMRRVIAGLTAAQSGRFWNYLGAELPW